MKSLYLLRHAPSDSSPAHGDDHERTLNRGGHQAARTIGRFLAAFDEVPNLAITSTAVRARSTLEIAHGAGEWSCAIEESIELYHADLQAILDCTRSAGKRYDRLMLVGHEPTLSVAAGRFIGGTVVRMPSAALVKIQFNIRSWQAIEWGGGELIWFITPTLLQAAIKAAG